MKPLAEALSVNSSRLLLIQIGYTSEEIEDLHSSGIGAVDLAEISENSAFEILGSTPANVFSTRADWSLWRQKNSSPLVVLVDFYSGAVFRPLELERFAFFGCKGLSSPIPPELTNISLNLRWRFNDIPVFPVCNSHELEVIASTLKKHVRQNQRIYFRGQNNQYNIHRGPKTRELLYGSSDVLEPSMLSTAFRWRFPYISIERYWRTIISDIDYRITGFKDRRWWVEDRFEAIYVSKNAMIAKWNSISVMAIAQHYGMPTYGLDVTTSIDIAWWFATHKYGSNYGHSFYRPHVWEGFSIQSWPVIYVLRSGSGEYIGKLDLPAKRPGRQEAVFAKGGWGPHGNICVDDLIALIVLAPEIGVAPGTTTEIFPGIYEDPMYAELIKLKNKLTEKHPLYIAAGLQYIQDFEI